MSTTIGASGKPPRDFATDFISQFRPKYIESNSSADEAIIRLPGLPRYDYLELLTLEDLTARKFLAALFGRTPFALFLDAPPNLGKRRERIICRRADAILVPDDDIAAVVARMGMPPERILSRQAWEPGIFSSIVPYRAATEAHRLVFTGELSPFSGAVDLQVCAAWWAGQHPERQIDITWVGQGDLHAVLDAQPLPPNMRQRFVGALAGAALADVFGECGLLAVPDLTCSRNAPLREAGAAGLPIIGSRRNHMVRRAVVPGETGWLIDPMNPRSIVGALSDAMSTTIQRLNEMRVASRAKVLSQVARRHSELTPASASSSR